MKKEVLSNHKIKFIIIKKNKNNKIVFELDFFLNTFYWQACRPFAAW